MTAEERELRLEIPDRAMVDIYARMTVGQRVAAALAATDLLRARIVAHVRQTHPDWDEGAIRAELARRWHGG